MKWQNFISVYDVLVSILPSALSTIGTIQLFESPVFPFIIGLSVLIVVIGALIQINIIKKEKALAEILATGYFINFLEKLAKNMPQETTFYFRKLNEKKHFKLKDISLRILMPASTDKLHEIDADYKENEQYEVVDLINSETVSPIWMKAYEEDGKLIILDFPRTLFSLPRFIQENIGKRSEKRMGKYYDSFLKKLEELINTNDHNIIYRKIKLEKVL